MKAWLRRWIGFRFGFGQASLSGNRPKDTMGDETE
jgi:hypothetical protein